MVNIRREMVNYFSEQFKDLSLVSPKLSEVLFLTLYVEDNQVLTSSFLIEELDEVVSQCDRNKILGPNGFNFSFFKRF